MKQRCKSKPGGRGSKSNLLHHPCHHGVPAHSTFPHRCLGNLPQHFLTTSKICGICAKKIYSAQKKNVRVFFLARKIFFGAEYFVTSADLFDLRKDKTPKKNNPHLKQNTGHIRQQTLKNKAWGSLRLVCSLCTPQCLLSRRSSGTSSLAPPSVDSKRQVPLAPLAVSGAATSLGQRKRELLDSVISYDLLRNIPKMLIFRLLNG